MFVNARSTFCFCCGAGCLSASAYFNKSHRRFCQIESRQLLYSNCSRNDSVFMEYWVPHLAGIQDCLCCPCYPATTCSTWVCLKYQSYFVGNRQILHGIACSSVAYASDVFWPSLMQNNPRNAGTSHSEKVIKKNACLLLHGIGTKQTRSILISSFQTVDTSPARCRTADLAMF